MDAGRHDRTQTPVSFPLEAAEGTSWELQPESGPALPLPLQREGGVAWFLLPSQPRETTRKFRLVERPNPPANPRATARTGPGSTALRLNGQPVLTYISGPGTLPRPDIRPEFLRGGYLHPVVTPAGVVVTDDYPTNHIHHHGVWWSWTKTVFEGRTPDFWNMGDRKGRTDFDKLLKTLEGPVFAGFQSEQIFTDLLAPQPKLALREQWTVRLLAVGPGDPFHLFDLESEQRCTTESPLKLPKYIYGGLAYRGPNAWNGATQARYLDSNRTTNRVAGNESRVRWHWLGGLVNGRLAGFASLGHPGNFRAPQPVRIHPQEPYTCWTPAQLGDWEIRPGETYRSKYRLVALDGEPDPALLDRLWNDYAEPPRVRLE